MRKYSTLYRDGVSIGVSCESEAAWRELQERFEKTPPRCTMELPDGVEILSVSIESAHHVGVCAKAMHAYQHCMPAGRFPENLSKAPI